MPPDSAKMIFALGGIAQLGERLNGIQEVSGSIPLISTRKKACNLNGLQASLFFIYMLIFAAR